MRLDQSGPAGNFTILVVRSGPISDLKVGKASAPLSLSSESGYGVASLK